MGLTKPLFYDIIISERTKEANKMNKWFTVQWVDDSCDSKFCETEEEADALIEELKNKEGVISIYKITYEAIQ